MKKFFLMMFLLATFVLSGCNTQAAGNQTKDDDLKISLLNIGQGDAILIRTKEQTILFDTANHTERDSFVKELEKFSVTKIDKLILTHPHVDHVGNAAMLITPKKKQLETYPYLAKISVAEVYDNDIPYTSASYKNYMKAIDELGISRKNLKVGDTLDFGSGVKFKVLFPTAEYVAQKKQQQIEAADDNNENDTDANTKIDRMYRMNNSSIVGKLTYKDFSMMLTGDCEKEAEAKILADNDAATLKCNILKAGHHGSRTSSSKKFVAAVNPEYVLISAGNKEENNNAHGSPHLRPLETFLAQGINPKNILCTRWNGSIIVTTDGKNFSVQSEVSENWVENWMAKKRKNGAK